MAKEELRSVLWVLRAGGNGGGGRPCSTKEKLKFGLRSCWSLRGIRTKGGESKADLRAPDLRSVPPSTPPRFEPLCQDRSELMRPTKPLPTSGFLSSALTLGSFLAVLFVAFSVFFVRSRTNARKALEEAYSREGERRLLMGTSRARRSKRIFWEWNAGPRVWIAGECEQSDATNESIDELTGV